MQQALARSPTSASTSASAPAPTVDGSSSASSADASSASAAAAASAFSDAHFENSVLASLAALQHTCNTLTAAVETLDLKMSELLDATLDSGGSFMPLPLLPSAPPSKLPSFLPPPTVIYSAAASASAAAASASARPSEHPKASKPGSSRKDEERQRGSRLLFSALKQILYTIPSQYEQVDSVYDEIKAFVAANLVVSPEITPTNIMTDNLMPYLRTAHGLDPSLRDMIWRHMSGVTGCMSVDTRRTLKRMIDNHYRGFKRKPASKDQIPVSMLPLLDVLRANAKHDGRISVELDQPNSKRVRV